MQASTNKERLDRLKIATILLGGVAAFAAIVPTPAAAQACTDGAGAGSIQCGDFAQADESGSSAVGDGSSATGIFSTAIGSNTVASDTSATALGQSADATAQNATAVGRSSEASGTSSTAVGASSIASEQNSTSLGAAAEAGAPRSMALGALSTANATSSVAIGYASIVALGFHSFVDGLIYEATYHAEVFTGSLATAGLLLHEFPEGIIAYFLARDAGLNQIRSIAWAFIFPFRVWRI